MPETFFHWHKATPDKWTGSSGVAADWCPQQRVQSADAEDPVQADLVVGDVRKQGPVFIAVPRSHWQQIIQDTGESKIMDRGTLQKRSQ